MELKEFVQNVLNDLVSAVEDARKESLRDMKLGNHKDSNQTVEFDIAVTVEDATSGAGKAGIKVFQFVESGGEVSREFKNSSVSRVKFGVQVDPWTKEEKATSDAKDVARVAEKRRNKRSSLR